MGVVNIVIAAVDFFALLGNIEAATYGYWVTLQNIGMACLIALPLVNVKNYIKVAVAAAIFVLYAVFHQTGNHQELLDVIVHGGFLGGFGWGAMLILDVFMTDVFFKDKRLFVLGSAFFLTLGVSSTYIFGPITLGSCSPAFILTSVGIGGVLFSLFFLTDKLPHGKFDPLVWWGKNPLIMFLIEFFVIGSYCSFVPDSMLEGAPWWLACIEGIVCVVLLTTVCYLLNKLKKPISL